jgi:hypothetical protein
MGAKEFSIYLQQLHNEIYSNLAIKATEVQGGAEAAAQLFARLEYLPPPYASLRPDETAAIRKVADLVVDKLKLSPEQDVYKFASSGAESARDRANLYLVYANLSDASQRLQAWAYNNAAHIDLTNKNYSESLNWSMQALDYANTASASHPKLNAEMRDLKSKAALTAAIASARLGNDRTAQRYKQLAIANGSKKATNLALPFFSLVPSAPMR